MAELLDIRLTAQGGVLTTGDALACGLTRAGLSRLARGGRLLRVRSGAYVDRSRFEAATPEGRRALAAASVCRMLGAGWAASHASALALLDLPVFEEKGARAEVHVARTTPGKHRPVAGVVAHAAVPPEALTRRAGVGCVRPAEAVLQWAAWAGVESGVVAADEAVRRGMTTREELRRALAGLALGPGRGSARAVTELVDGRSGSVGESRTRVLLHALGLPEVELQVELHDGRGSLVGWVDFLFRRQRTVVEFDGLLKYGEATARSVLVAEKHREDRLRSLGYEVVRLTWADLSRPDQVDRSIRAAFARQARRAS